MITEIRAFTDNAIDLVEGLLVAISLGTGSIDDLVEFAQNDTYTEVVLTDVSIPVGPYENKYDMGKVFIDNLTEEQVATLIANDNVWPWISIQLRNTVFTKKSKIFVGDLSRHVIKQVGGRSAKAGHRHLVRGAVTAVSRFGENARVLLAEPNGHSKLEEQIMSRKENVQLAGSCEFVRAARILYFDDTKQSTKRGAKGEGAGSVMRLIGLVEQLNVNYDVTAMTAEEIIDILPKNEFKKFLAA